jgi:homocysteine S-methyltransferase
MKLIDGGLSTELTRLGVTFGGELWTGQALLNDSQKLLEAHRNYALAGAEIVISSSYQLSRQGFIEVGLTAADADKALAKSIEVARAAVAGTPAKVAASVGPYGAVLHDGSEYRGVYEVDQVFLENFHRERLELLLSANPDFLAIETIPNLIEARALVTVLAGIEIPKWFSFTAGSGTNLWSGESVREAIGVVSKLDNLVAVGFNCVSPELVETLAAEAKAATNLPIIVYPNRGGVWDSENGIWLEGEPRTLASWLPVWQGLGIGYIGGCCGTDATDIAELNRSLAG